MSAEFARAMRTYRLWRTSTVLLVVGAVETGVLAWQRQSWLVGAVCVPLVALAMVAARKASRLRQAMKR
jgi:hypothetical protein